MTDNLTRKLDALSKSYASPSQTKRIISTAIIPSLAYSFPVVPCTPNLLNRWDQKIGRCVKKEFGMDRTNPSTAIIRENTRSFGLGCPSVGVEYHTRCAEALINSLNCTTPRHAKITKTLLLKQIINLNLIADALTVADKTSSLPMRRRLDYSLRVRQLLSIQRSKPHIFIDNNEHFTNKLDKVSLLVSNKKIMFTIQNLIVSIVDSLKSLGINSLTELLQRYNNSHVISLTSLQDKYRNSWKENHEQAFRCLVALLSSPPTQDITSDIARNIFKSSRIPSLPTLKTNHTPTQMTMKPSSIPGLVTAFCETKNTTNLSPGNSDIAIKLLHNQNNEPKRYVHPTTGRRLREQSSPRKKRKEKLRKQQKAPHIN